MGHCAGEGYWGGGKEVWVVSAVWSNGAAVSKSVSSRHVMFKKGVEAHARYA